MLASPLTLTADSPNADIASAFQQIGDVLEVRGENPFRTRAYRRAAESIRYLEIPLKDIWHTGKLKDIPGVGATFQSYLEELFTTGKVAFFHEVYADVPPSMHVLTQISGIGVKSALLLAQTFELSDPTTAVEVLQEKATAGEIQKLAGFGAKSEKQILEALQLFKQQQAKERRYVLPVAEMVAGKVIAYLKQQPVVEEALALGSLRRRAATVGDVDIAVLTAAPDEVMTHVRAYADLLQVLASGPKMTRFLDKTGIQIDVKTQDHDGWGSMIHHYTGSRQHNIALRSLAREKGWSLGENGMKKGEELLRYRTELELYADLGLDYIPPELREDRGEIKAAREHRLPTLIEVSDLKGDLHLHTDLDDYPTSHDMGSSSIPELLDTAHELGYEYIGLADHNPKFTGLTPEERLAALEQRNRQIEYFTEEYVEQTGNQIQVFKGLEIDIRPDGSLALEEEGFELLDYAIVSLHSQFQQSPAESTKRVVRALDHPKVKIWGHPTGRLLERRAGAELDWDEVFAFCAAHDKWVEINSSPYRLDLPDALVMLAHRHQVKLIVNTDSHHYDQMQMHEYGIAMARRGWTEAGQVVNTLPVGEFGRELLVQV